MTKGKSSNILTQIGGCIEKPRNRVSRTNNFDINIRTVCKMRLENVLTTIGKLQMSLNNRRQLTIVTSGRRQW